MHWGCGQTLRTLHRAGGWSSGHAGRTGCRRVSRSCRGRCWWEGEQGGLAGETLLGNCSMTPWYTDHNIAQCRGTGKSFTRGLFYKHF